MKHSSGDRCMALAGLFQAAELVQQIAHGRSTDATAVSALLGSVFFIDADSVVEIYGGVHGLRMGLNGLNNHLSKKPGAGELEVIRYVINLLRLERKLARRRDLIQLLREQIQKVKRSTHPFSPDQQNVVSALAALYQRTISTLSPKIMVQGEPAVLADPVKTSLIRATLLAGVRSTLLWRQCGGSRIFLLLQRGAILQEADRLLRQ